MRKLSYSILTCAVAFSLFTGSGEVEAQTFSDIPKNYEYYNQIEQLAELGIITKNEKFNPESELTRGQMAKMIALALKLDTTNVTDPQFKDVPKSHQFYPYIAALVNKGIVSGYPDKTFGVGNKVKNSHLAKFLVNGLGLEHAQHELFYMNGATKDSETYTNIATLDFYQVALYSLLEANENVLRYEAAAMIANALQLNTEKMVRVPIAQLPALKNNRDEPLSLDVTRTNLNAQFDGINNEIVLMPKQPGKSGVYTYLDDEIAVLQVDIAEDLTIHYEPVQMLDTAYKRMDKYYVSSSNEKLIAHLTFEDLTGGDPISKISAQQENLEYYEQAYIYSGKPNNLYKTTLEYTNGQTETFFFESIEEQMNIALKPLHVGNAQSVKIETWSPLLTLTSGNADAVHIVSPITNYDDGAYTEYVQFSDVGTYTFTTSSNDMYQVNVYEIEGKLMGNFFSVY